MKNLKQIKISELGQSFCRIENLGKGNSETIKWAKV